MARTAIVVAFSTTQDMADEIDRLAADEGRTRSGLLREAVRAYQASALAGPPRPADPASLQGHPPQPAASLPGLARVLARRPEIATVCAEAYVSRLWVFGSAVRDDFSLGRSDFDFLVEFRPDAARKPWFGEMADLRTALSQVLDGPVDLGEMGSLLNPYVRSIADAEKVLVYEHA